MSVCVPKRESAHAHGSTLWVCMGICERAHAQLHAHRHMHVCVVFDRESACTYGCVSMRICVFPRRVPVHRCLPICVCVGVFEKESMCTDS